MKRIQSGAIRAIRDHPRWTLAGLCTVLGLIPIVTPVILWLAGLIVWRSDFEAYKHQAAIKEAWHKVGHARAKADRFNDAIDLLRSRYSQEQFVELYRERLSEANGELRAAGECAQKLSDGAERCQ